MKYIILFILLFTSINASAQQCVPAYDFGQGGVFVIPANPDERNNGKTNLIFDTPKENQVAAWISTNFSTIGQADNNNDSNDAESVLKLYIDGSWAPWGGGDPSKITTKCTLEPCDPNDSSQALCLSGGQHVHVEKDASNIPCVLDQGWGLYGLIAIDQYTKDKNGKTSSQAQDPNDPKYARSLPSEYFRTFRISPLAKDQDGYFFTLKNTEQCDINAKTKQTTCVADRDENGRSIIKKGALYFKIYDTYYQDNTGSYNVTIASGVVGKAGFIEQAIDYFTKVMRSTTKKIYESLTSNLGFITIVRSLILLYTATSGLLFMMGMLRMHVSELIVRLTKAALILILISPGSWNFFNNNLFLFFTDGAESLATMVTKSAFTYSSEFGMGQYILPKDATAVSVFDNVVKMVFLNWAIHEKLAGMIFCDWFIVYYIFMYVSIAIMLMAILRSIVLYVTSILLVTLLLVIAPIFMVMLLFNLTKDLFNSWLKQLWVNALMLIVVSVTMALMINLILNQFENLLYYKVCWQSVHKFKIAGITVWDFWFWYPDDKSQLESCMTLANFLAYLVVCVLFNAFMQQVPELIDALASSGLFPLSSMFHGMYATLHNSKTYNYIVSAGYQLRAITPGLLPTNLMLFKPVNRLAVGADQIFSSTTGKFEQTFGQGSIASSTQVFKPVRDFVGSKVDLVTDLTKSSNTLVVDGQENRRDRNIFE